MKAVSVLCVKCGYLMHCRYANLKFITGYSSNFVCRLDKISEVEQEENLQFQLKTVRVETHKGCLER